MREKLQLCLAWKSLTVRSWQADSTTMEGVMIWRALTPERAMQLLISLLSDSRKMPSVVPTSTMADTSSRLMEAWLPLGVKTLVISSESSTRG